MISRFLITGGSIWKLVGLNCVIETKINHIFNLPLFNPSGLQS
jgi:hypothetical protein